MTSAIYRRSFGDPQSMRALTVLNVELQSLESFADRFAEICRLYTWIHDEGIMMVEDVLIVMIEHAKDIASLESQALVVKREPYVRVISNFGKWLPIEVIK